MNAVVVGIAIMVGGTTLLLGLRAAGRWLSSAISSDIHDGIGNVVREQLEVLNVKVDNLDRRDAKGQSDLMDRLNEVEAANTRDHGLVAQRLAAVESRLGLVEQRLPPLPPVSIEINNEGGNT